MGRFLDGLDLGFQELLGLKVENRVSAPANPESGYIYFDTTANSYRLYQNGTWFELAASGVLVGEASSRPVASAGTAGTLFWALDESRLYIDEGGSWSAVASEAGSAGGTPAFVNVEYTGDNTVARPDAGTVYWKGWPAELTPTNVAPGDFIFTPEV